MSGKTFVRSLPLFALLATLGGRSTAQTWWNPDYAHRAGVTVTNNDAAATPIPTSAEVLLPLDKSMRADRLDVRAVYYDGATSQEVDSKVFRDLTQASPFFAENLNAGTTSYATLPAGSSITPDGVAGDDSGAQLTLPFNFPFAGSSSNTVFMSIDGYVVPGTAKVYSQYGPAIRCSVRGIYPYSSDFTIPPYRGPAGTAMYMYADTTQAVFRWEVAESGGSALIAKFAAILKPDGSIRYVYSDTVHPTSAPTGGPGSYAETAYGVQVGFCGGGVIHYPTDNYPTSADFSNHPDITYTSTEAVRAVFRLQQSIPAGATSTGQYFIYYGNPSPSSAAARNLKRVFDTVVDFSSAANVVGQPPPDWDLQAGNTMTVQDYQGGKVGVLNLGTPDHPRATVKATAMPAFLNPEILAHVAPDGRGHLEMAPMVRVVSNTADANFQGGYGYDVGSFAVGVGGSHVVSYINPAINNSPADMGGVSDPQKADVYANVLFRVTGSPGLIRGKNWRDDQPEPAGPMLQVDRSQQHPMHGATEDPPYTAAGTTGMAGYDQQIAVDYIALRELRGLASTPAAAESFTSPGPFIQGTVLSAATGAPFASSTVTITDATTFSQTVSVNATGAYRLTVPAGTYSVTATGPTFCETQTQTGVVASDSGATNFSLVFGCGTLTGFCRSAIDNQPQANATVTLIDSKNGYYVTSATTDKSGFYTIAYPSGGNYYVGAMSPLGYGARVPVTLPSGGAAIQNLSMTVLPNGDCEIPNSSNSFALGWTTSFDNPGAYEYSQAQNHTPGGHWSMAIKDAATPLHQSANELSGLNNPPVASFALPVRSDVFDITASVWVYFTKIGQNVSMRLRDGFPLAGGQNRVWAKAGSPPDPNNKNTAGLDGDGNVPVGQWYEIRAFAPVGNILKNNAYQLQMNLYAMNSAFVQSNYPAFSGGADGTIYFDDWTITQTVKSSGLGRIVDVAGNPVPNALAGPMTDAGGLDGPNLISGPVTYSDSSGNFTLYEAADGAVPLGAWLPVYPASTGALPTWGNLAGVGTITTSASPSSRTTFTVKKTGVVSIGAAGTATSQTAADVAPTTDNNVTTRWASVGNLIDDTLSFDLGSVKSIDQVELMWELATPDVYTVSVGSDPFSMIDVMDVAGGGATLGIPALGLSLSISLLSEGPYHVIRLPSTMNARYINVHMNGYTGGLGNYSLIEMRALSAASTVPALTRADATNALRIAGGLVQATQDDVFRLDVNGDGKLTAADAIAIARIAP